MAGVLIDGFPTSISFMGCSLNICVKTLTPPEMDSGGFIDLGGFMSPIYRRYRMKAPKRLISLNSFTLTAAYDPIIYSQGMILSLARVGSLQQISIGFPDSSSLTFWGFIEKITPGENKEGEMPMVTITVTPSLWNGTFSSDGCPVEEAPVYQNGSGQSFRYC